MLDRPVSSLKQPRDRMAVAGDIVRSSCGCLFDVLEQHLATVSCRLRLVCDQHYGTYLGEDPWYIGHGNYDILDPLATALMGLE